MSLSSQLFESAQQVLPAGVNSPVRAFRGVSGEPIFIKQGRGAYLTDVDNHEYIDYVCSWGPLILGHAHPAVVGRVTEAVQRGMSFGAPTEVEVELAQKVRELMPHIEMMRFVSSGTEAAMSAIRLARGYTKRDKILKFKGCYHGHADSLLVSAGSGALTFGIPSSAGVPHSLAEHTIVVDFNRLDQVKQVFAKHGHEIAAIIVEPVAANMNLVLPVPGFLEGLREVCDAYRSLLIFDEVITGFRVSLGGAQAHYQVKPDLTILGKIIGGGMPAAVFGGRADIMHAIAPLGSVYQAGTLSGNPVAMSAGLATLELISAPYFYSDLATKTDKLTQGIKQAAERHQVPLQVRSIGSIFGVFFTAATSIETEDDVTQCDIAKFKKFFHAMLNKGIYLAPSAFEVGFVSSAHTDQELDITLKAIDEVFATL